MRLNLPENVLMQWWFILLLIYKYRAAWTFDTILYSYFFIHINATVSTCPQAMTKYITDCSSASLGLIIKDGLVLFKLCSLNVYQLFIDMTMVKSCSYEIIKNNNVIHICAHCQTWCIYIYTYILVLIIVKLYWRQITMKKRIYYMYRYLKE